jgi:histidine triad (HIT) family protein
VVPVAHRETILDLQEPEMSQLMETLVMAAHVIAAADRQPGIAVWQNNGVDVDQTIPHVHFHVASSLPEGGTERGEVQELSVDETDAIARRLKPHVEGAAHPAD